MKKLVFLMAVVFVTMSSFTSGTDCHAYAQNAVQQETIAFGEGLNQEEYAAAYTFYYNGCVDSNNEGSELLNPVFVN